MSEPTEVSLDLEGLRDRGLSSLSIQDVNWATQRLSRGSKQSLLRHVGLKLDPKYLRKGIGPLLQARLSQVPTKDRWAVAILLQERCLEEFARVLGNSFEDPSLRQLSEAVPQVVVRAGSGLVALTLACALHRDAKASDHIREILSGPEWAGDGVAGPQNTDSGLETGPMGVAGATGSPTAKSDTPGGVDRPETAQEERDPEVLLLLPLRRMRERVDAAMQDSDATYYLNLLLLGEMVTKLVALTMVSCIDPERDDNGLAYTTQYTLLRADGIGAWSAAVQQLTTAPVYRLLDNHAKSAHTSLTQRFGADSEAWQRRAVDSLNQATSCFPNLATEQAVGKVSIAQWFQLFAALRNKTRGHGADLVSWQAAAATPLADSLTTLISELEPFRWPWWHVHRTAAGQAKLRRLGGPTSQPPPTTTDDIVPSVYLAGDGILRPVALLRTSTDLEDFYLPNGDAQEKQERYEELSYVTGQKRWAPLRSFVRPPRDLPTSETHGSSDLRAVGNVLTNLPEPPSDYVRRAELEEQLRNVMTDTRHPVVAINGPGGIGKTSLALQVLHDLAEREAFTCVFWFSARDIDLDPIRGPLAVKPAAQSLNQIARQYAGFVEPARLTDNSSDELAERFLRSLGEGDAGPMLYVFDNFETVHNPAQLFRELNEFVRLPNKILITTRYRDFKGDWPLDVDGMSRPEFDALVSTSASRLNITGVLQGHGSWVDSLYRESGGHPYVVNVALGDVARSRKVGKRFERIMASKDDILDALFERSFNRLSPDAQRVFFTLCRWRALIPSIALEAVLTRPSSDRIDVERALQHLIDSSLVQRTYSEVDAESFLHVPAAAYRFGTAQLEFSDIADLIEDDARFLHHFGAVSDNVAKSGFSSHVHRYYENARTLSGEALGEAIAIGEYVARRYPESWLLLARLQRDLLSGGQIAAKASYQSYLSRCPDDADAWLELADVCRTTRDDLGELRASANASQNAERRYAALSSSLAMIRERCDAGLIKVESKQKRSHLVSLCRGWHPRENQATLSDCYNLARLAERSGDLEETLFWAEQGLRKDRRNQRLQDIQEWARSTMRGRAR